MKRAGIRVTLNTQLTADDIDALVSSLERHIPAVLHEEGVEAEEVEAAFRRARVGPSRRSSLEVLTAELSGAGLGPSRPPRGARLPRSIRLECATTIEDVEPAEWDRLLGSVGAVSWESMRMQERLFTKRRVEAERWRFRYLIARDPSGAPVAATCFTLALGKDDMLMRPDVSEAVERRREEDPGFLTSLVLGSGSSLSE